MCRLVCDLQFSRSSYCLKFLVAVPSGWVHQRDQQIVEPHESTLSHNLDTSYGGKQLSVVVRAVVDQKISIYLPCSVFGRFGAMHSICRNPSLDRVRLETC